MAGRPKKSPVSPQRVRSRKLKHPTKITRSAFGKLPWSSLTVAVLGLATVLGFLVAWQTHRPMGDTSGSVSVPSPLATVHLPPVEEARPVRKKVVLVIDDAGYRLDHLEKFLSLPFPFAVAILPFLPNSQRSLEMVLRAGKTAMLHMPMQPRGGQDPGEGALMLSDSPMTIRQKLGRAIDSLAGIVGVNNHMGSWFTTARDKMRIVLEEIQGRGLFFLDSYTSIESQAVALGDEASIKILQRDVFLDHEDTPEFFDRALQETLKLLRKKDHVVLIGHVQSPGLVEKLRQFQQNHAHELEFVSPEALLK